MCARRGVVQKNSVLEMSRTYVYYTNHENLKGIWKYMLIVD